MSSNPRNTAALAALFLLYALVMASLVFALWRGTADVRKQAERQWAQFDSTEVAR